MSFAEFRMQSDSVSVREGLIQAFETPPLSRLGPEARAVAELVLAEVLNNIVEHAYRDGHGPIVLGFQRAADALNCRIVDFGERMPEGRLPEGQPPFPRDLAEGGYGWHLIRSLARDLRYEWVGEGNWLTFALPLDQSA
ncbi:ATP-binding protein [Pseudogemmobacter sonorensis]|uniref:ATP-binding protein n=1 Tax=Pseudogemmobacter sonorensis TaxID=2989681 RepID=UPI0036788A7C